MCQLSQIGLSDTRTKLKRVHLHQKPIHAKKALGQYFTSSIIAEYMASMLDKPNSEKISMLDAGAGEGILTVSTSIKLLEYGCKNVHAILYELDGSLIGCLNQNMETVQKKFKSKNANFTYEVRNTDFVIDRPDKKESFDISVINPPYFKYNVKTSPYARAVGDLYKGDPNIYASFMAIVAASLKRNGQMVAITPRSFTNGLYFKSFRHYLLSISAIASIHIFKHRNRIFNNNVDEVLQENIISKFLKSDKPGSVEVRSSDCDLNLEETTYHYYPYELIVDQSNDHNLIRVPESLAEAKILKQAENLKSTFTDSGYFISTGPVVEYRARDYIVSPDNEQSTIPLYKPHNITPYQALWTGNQKKDVRFELNSHSEKHTVANKNYVLLKRFSSKDEKRRLVSGVYLANDFQNLQYIGFANKINYIGLKDCNLTKTEAYGLSAIFNGSFFDRYFRCISGNTQVNATEIRIMRFPTKEQVKAIGAEVLKLQKFNAVTNDEIVNRILGFKETS